MVLDDVAEVLAVQRAAARVREQHDVALRRHPLELVRVDIAVGRVRTAVNLENQRVLLRASKSGGFRIQPWIFLPSKLVYQISSGSLCWISLNSSSLTCVIARAGRCAPSTMEMSPMFVCVESVAAIVVPSFDAL